MKRRVKMKWNGEMIICVLSKSLKISRWHGSAACGETPPPPPLPVLVSVLTLVPGSDSFIGTSQQAHEIHELQRDSSCEYLILTSANEFYGMFNCC